MSDQYTLGPGDHRAFTTRPVGLTTYLFLRGGKGGPSEATYHTELCCQDDHKVTLKEEEPQKIDISSAAGALVTVRNTGFRELQVWTDY